MLKNLFILIALFSSCAHYRLKDKNNPFAQYQISKLYIPMFYNQSNFPGVNGILTQKIYQTLAQYNHLKIVSKASEADAALVGIVESPQSMREAISTNSTKSAKNTYSEVLKDTDKDYIIPSVNEVNLSLRIVLIKHPSKEEIDFFQNPKTKNIMSSKIIFNQSISLSEEYNIKELQGEATKVLGSQNRGVQREAISDLTDVAAEKFKEVILYAF